MDNGKQTEGFSGGRVRGLLGRPGLPIASIHGIEIRLDISVLIIFTLVVYSLAAGVFPGWHPDWGRGQAWLVALIAGLIFFASLLAHELAHALVAQKRGIPVPRITLFVFGGVSEMEREPDSPATEFAVAIVGPLTSLAIGIAFTALGLISAGAPFLELLRQDPANAYAVLDAAETLLLWLGPVNLMLAIFNLIPGFPLDGGRVFRAALWWLSGDMEQATRWAAATGRGFAWLLMGLGALQALRGALVAGLWLVLIGWFLNNAARSNYSYLLLRKAVAALSVRDLMRTRFDVAAEDLAVSRFIEECLLRSAQSAWPVVRGEAVAGIVSMDEIMRVPLEQRRTLRLRDVMTPITESVSPDLGGRAALELLLKSEHDPVPVIEGQRIVGLLHRADIMRWLALHQLRASDA